MLGFMTRSTLQVRNSQLSLEEGCMLFQPPLAHTDLMWDKVSDTKLLLAWNKEMIVLAFRGTASLSNVFADLQVLHSCNSHTMQSHSL